MKSHFHKSPSLFTITVIILFTNLFNAILCQETVPNNDCQPLQCGTVTIDYPFWGSTRPNYCGYDSPDFQITCQSNVTELTFDSVDYRVLDTDSTTQTITVARNDLWANICPRSLYNTTYNLSFFNGNNSNQQNVSIYYDCSTTIPVAQQTVGSFLCNVNGSQIDNYFGRTSSTVTGGWLEYLVQCENHIDVPVNQTWADQFAVAGTAREEDLRSALEAGFKLKWTANNDECNQCVKSGGRCGSNSTSPELFACYCANGNFSLTCNNTNGTGGSKGDRRNIKWKLIIGFVCVTIGGSMLLVFFKIRRRWKNQKHTDDQLQNNHALERIILNNYASLAPKRFNYSEIKKMTKSFSEKVGQGGYGSVYKGELPNGELVAVKLLAGTHGDGEDFINEVSSISRTSHVNIVKHLGFCTERNKRALVYEFMPNGSLDKFLRGDGSHLDWNTLFRVAKGIARGLEYLHQGCNTRIVHFDIKPHNILLDKEFVPKISDFGLAKLCKKKESIVSVFGARGTAGYMAPEVFFKSLGGASHKSDVYSYGMMVLEMTGARKHNIRSTSSTSEAYFPDWVYKQVETGGSLEDYGVTTEEEEEIARKMMTVSLWCIQSDPSQRPSISKVVEMWEGDESLQVPPRKFWTSPTRPLQSISSLISYRLTSEEDISS